MNGYRNRMKQPDALRIRTDWLRAGDYLGFMTRKFLNRKCGLRRKSLGVALDRKDAGRRLAIAVEEQRIICDRFFNQLFEQK